MTETLLKTGYSQSKSDYSLYINSTNGGFTAILVYVDDLILIGTDINEIDRVKALMDEKFSIKDLGNLKYSLGFQVTRNQIGISLCQRKYALDILEETGSLAAKPYSTPMEPHLQLHKESRKLLNEITVYRILWGCYSTEHAPDQRYPMQWES